MGVKILNNIKNGPEMNFEHPHLDPFGKGPVDVEGLNGQIPFGSES